MVWEPFSLQIYFQSSLGLRVAGSKEHQWWGCLLLPNLIEQSRRQLELLKEKPIR